MNDERLEPGEVKSALQNTMPTPPPTKPRIDTKRLLVLAGSALAILILLGITAWGIQQGSSSKKANNEVSNLEAKNKKLNDELEKRKDTTGEENIDKSLFQSVFLKNEQVYFGKITKLTETQLTLENIYYLKTSKPGVNVDHLDGDVSLVKLGSELHGPQDVMFIERKEVQFWENLKPDGKVAKAIAEYEKQH